MISALRAYKTFTATMDYVKAIEKMKKKEIKRRTKRNANRTDGLI